MWSCSCMSGVSHHTSLRNYMAQHFPSIRIREPFRIPCVGTRQMGKGILE